MKFFCSVLTGLLISAGVTFAAAPAANPTPSTNASVKKDAGKSAAKSEPAQPEAATPPASAPAPVAASGPAGLKLDDYIKDLSDQLHLSDAEKTEIQGDYVNDGPALQKILNDDLLSPLQKTLQVDNLRDLRNAKIEALLTDVDRRKAFPLIEAEYRAALIDLAANGGLVATPAAPAIPAPAAKS